MTENVLFLAMEREIRPIFHVLGANTPAVRKELMSSKFLNNFWGPMESFLHGHNQDIVGRGQQVWAS